MLKQKFLNFILNSPKKSIALSLFLLLIAILGLQFLKPNFSYRIWFKEDGPHLVRFDQFEKQFGSDEMAVVMLESESGVFDSETSQTIIELTDKFWQIPDVIRVNSLSNFNWTHAAGDDIAVDPFLSKGETLTAEFLASRKDIALNHRSIKKYLASADAKIAIFYLKLKPFLGATPDYEKVTLAIRELLEEFKNKSDHKFHLTGSVSLNQSFKESTQKDLSFLVPMVILMAIVFLSFSLKSFGGVLISLSIIFSSIILTMGAAGWMGFELNNITGMVPQFMIAIGIADSVHILVSYFNLISKGLTRQEAAQVALEKNFRPTLLTSITTAFGFFSFATAGIAPIAGMGIISGVGTVLAWLITYTLLGPLLLKLKPKVYANLKNSDDVFRASQRGISFTDFIDRYKGLIISIFILLGAVDIYLISKIEVDSNPVAYFDKQFPFRKATDFMEERIGGSLGGEIVIDSGAEDGIKDPDFLLKAEKLQNWIDSLPYISKTVSILDILKDTNKSLNGGDDSFYKLPATKEEIAQQLFLYTMSIPQGMDLNDRMTIKNDRMKMTVMWTLHKSSEILQFTDDVHAKAKELGLNAHMTGKPHLWQTINEPIVKSFITSFSIAIILISIILIIGLNSVKIGLLSMIPNSLPLFFGGGLISLLGKYLDIGTVIVGSICLGIAVDDTIHFVSSFIKYKKEGKTTRNAIELIMTHVAPALIVTTLVLVVSFGTFILGSFVPNQNFGILVSCVLSFALIADLFLLPALLLLVGDKFFEKAD